MVHIIPPGVIMGVPGSDRRAVRRDFGRQPLRMVRPFRGTETGTEADKQASVCVIGT